MGLLAGAVGLVVLAWLFSSLTVSVSEMNCSGAWPGAFQLPDVACRHRRRERRAQQSVERLRHPHASGFRLYNVSGLDAVELRLRNGDIRRIGTDDARGLAAALRRP